MIILGKAFVDYGIRPKLQEFIQMLLATVICVLTIG